jgi:hypothetical protein
MNISFATCAAALMAGLCAATAASAHTQAAYWRTQDIAFVYRGQSSLYDCVSLRNKVVQVLGEIGAKVGTRVDSLGCQISQSEVPSQLATLRITIVSPAPATNELRQELARLDSRRELLERVGATPPSTEEFPADWQDVDVARTSAARFGSEDCDLLRQLREQVLAKLAVKMLAYDRTCSSQRLRLPTLKVAVLVPAVVPGA